VFALCKHSKLAASTSAVGVLILFGTNIMSFDSSESQWKAIIWTSRCSGILSILGSTTIIFMILRGRKNISSTHNRLLLCMSGVDILNSSALAVSASAHNNGAQGNQATCTAQGFFITLGFAVPLYNAMICLYYMAIIRFKLKEDVISTRYEPWMHAVALMSPLTFAIAAASFGDFRPTGAASYCWIPNKSAETYSESQSSIASWLRLSATVLSFLTFIVIVGSMTLIYLTVRNQAKKMQRYQFDQRGGEYSTLIASRETARQAFLYVAAYLITMLWPSIVLMVGNAGAGVVPFGIVLMLSLFFPLQGFWNFIIYLRPRFIKVGNQNSDKGFFWVLRATVMTIDFNRPAHPPPSAERSSRFLSGFFDLLKRGRQSQSQSLDEIEESSLSGESSNELALSSSLESSKISTQQVSQTMRSVEIVGHDSPSGDDNNEPSPEIEERVSNVRQLSSSEIEEADNTELHPSIKGITATQDCDSSIPV
jgi:hypothetical protein